MSKKTIILVLAGLFSLLPLSGQIRSERVLRDWEFRLGDYSEASEGWKKVTVPHDWAITGPFDKANDLQTVAVVQNGETVPTQKTGRTGGLPYMGKGCYRTSIDIENLEGRRYELLFDGAMSEARVFVNGEKVCEWPYGYNAFHCDVTPYLHSGSNSVLVLLENRPFSSRWYPGAGLYRKVRLLETSPVHIPVWGVCVRTPHIEKDYASVNISTEIEGAGEGDSFIFEAAILDSEGNILTSRSDRRAICHGESARQNLTLPTPHLWFPEDPALYTCRVKVYKDAELIDSVSTRFGVRTAEFIADKGFFLNGQRRIIHGVCQHHDAGPLGAAVTRPALRHQIELLKEMGCDAIRTSHNMPAEELVELCDEMGVMLMAETFDEWDVAKCENGYHRFFADWAEKDMVNLIRHFRNNPSVIMWSIGNEVPTQWTEGGYKTAAFLQAICRREDPTRQTTCGMDQFDAVVGNGFAAQVDVPGFNYKPRRYAEAYLKLPQNIILGSETASTVSSRGVYHLPSKDLGGDLTSMGGSTLLTEDHQSSSYDIEHCYWSNIPEQDLAADEDYPWMGGQFVWTGFDYLGEPSPYDTDAWPNHSSVFGIMDLASIPKDRFWLYRSVWRKDSPTLHVLPHWTWPGCEGKNVPVVAYTSYPSAELFVNGVSQGIARKEAPVSVSEDPQNPLPIAPDSTLVRRFRLIWPDVKYEKGEIRVVAFDSEGRPAAEQTVRTAGKPYALRLTPYTGPESIFGNEGFGAGSTGIADGSSKSATNSASGAAATLKADGEDLCYINVCVVDRDGNPVPFEGREVSVSVEGAGSFRAMANGDPTCLEMFHTGKMHLFSGQLTVIVQSGTKAGDIRVKATAKGLKSATTSIKVN